LLSLFRKCSNRRLGFFIGAGTGLLLLIGGIIAFVVVMTSRKYRIFNSMLFAINIYLK
jgi:zinc transporter ZupT